MSSVIQSDFDALVALYNSTDGANWTANSGWNTLTNENIETWKGVTVQGDRVTQIILPDNNLSGTLPTELGNLTNLTQLDISGNQTITGTIPTELFKLSNLIFIDLSDNELSGNIPTDLNNLNLLQTLDLSDNQLDGSIPTELGNLSSLEILYLDTNLLTGIIPTELGNLTNLRELDLGINQLTGSIPSELGNISSLEILYLDNNLLTGSIPDSIKNNPNLKDPNLENPPYFDQTFGPFTINEKSSVGTIIGTITANDLNNDTLTYSIIAGNNDIDGDLNPAFSIESTAGLITVNDSDDLIFNTQSTFNLTVQAADSIGKDTTEIIVNLNETTAPVVTINSLITNNNTPILTGTINDNLATITVNINDIDYTATISNNSWSVNVTNPLSDGIYDVSVTAIDSIGNLGIDNTTNELTVDTTAPVVTINSLITNNNTPILTGTINDNLATITVNINDIDYTATISNNSWSVNITDFLIDGIYEVSVSAIDSIGNLGIDETTNELTVDTKPPIVTVDTLLTNDNTPILTGTIDDNLATISVNINNIDYTPTISNNNWSVNITDFLIDGIYEVSVSAIDNAGNIGQDETINELTINQSPIIEPEFGPFTIDENSLSGTQVATITATDTNNDPLTYKIINGNKDINGDGNLPFIINTGIITVNDEKDLIFDIQSSFNLTIEVTDEINIPVKTTVKILLNQIQELLAQKGEDSPTIKGDNTSFVTQETQNIPASNIQQTNTLTAPQFIVTPENVTDRQRLYGGSNDNYLVANTGDNLFAGKGNDTLDASQGDGNNRLFGGEDDDILIGGKGDLLIGGNGKDQFKIVNNSLGNDPVIILDFETNNDKIDLSDLIINEQKVSFGNLIFDEQTTEKIGLKVEGKDEAIALILNVNTEELKNENLFNFG